MYLQPTAKVNKELSSSETYYLYDNDTWIVIEQVTECWKLHVMIHKQRKRRYTWVNSLVN